MKLSKEYLTERLKSTSVTELATEIADKMAATYHGADLINRAATIAKFEAMLKPLAPKKEITAAEMFESMGITVVRVA